MTSIVPKTGITVLKDGCKVSSLKKWKDSKTLKKLQKPVVVGQ